jgi:hypothetical protein
MYSCSTTTTTTSFDIRVCPHDGSRELCALDEMFASHLLGFSDGDSRGGKKFPVPATTQEQT